MSDLLLFSIRWLGLLAVLIVAAYFLNAKPRTSVAYLAVGVCAGMFTYRLVSGYLFQLTPIPVCLWESREYLHES